MNMTLSHPLASSTPTKASTPPSHRTSLRCLEINCNSIQSSERSAAFTSIIANQDPDIVFGCESKLSPEDPTYSSFPPNYNVFRKERVNSGGGGIFIAVKSSIPASELPTYQQIRKMNPSGLLSTWQNRKRYIYALSISLRLLHLPDWTTCLNPSLKCSMLTRNHTPTLWSAATLTVVISTGNVTLQ